MLQKPQSLWEWGNIQVMGLKCSKRHLYTHLFSGVWDLNTTFKRCHKALLSTDKTMPCDCIWEHQNTGQWEIWAQAFRLRFGRQNVAFPSSAIPRWRYEVRCFWTWSCWIRLRSAPSTKTVCKRFPLAPTAPWAQQPYETPPLSPPSLWAPRVRWPAAAPRIGWPPGGGTVWRPVGLKEAGYPDTSHWSCAAMPALGASTSTGETEKVETG